MDYVSLHDIPDQRGRRRFAFEYDVPRIVSLGYDADQFFTVHHRQRADIFFSHFCHSFKNCGVRANSPKAPVFLCKKMFYGHDAPPYPCRNLGAHCDVLPLTPRRPWHRVERHQCFNVWTIILPFWLSAVVPKVSSTAPMALTEGADSLQIAERLRCN